MLGGVQRIRRNPEEQPRCNYLVIRRHHHQKGDISARYHSCEIDWRVRPKVCDSREIIRLSLLLCGAVRDQLVVSSAAERDGIGVRLPAILRKIVDLARATSLLSRNTQGEKQCKRTSTKLSFRSTGAVHQTTARSVQQPAKSRGNSTNDS